MNSDKQGRAMCACGSSGAAPGAEPAAAAPQCRCRTAPRAPSPAQNITAAIAAADLTGTGFLRLRSFAASNAQPVPDVIVTISQRSGTGIPDKTVTTGPEALSDDVAIACPPRSYSLDENNRTVLPYAVVDVTAEHEGYDPVHVAGVQVFDAVSLRISISPRTSCSRAANPPAPPRCLPAARVFWTSPSSPKRSRCTWAAPRPMCRT